MKKIILASQSPRLKEIMETAGYDFEIIVSNAEEKIEENLTPEEVAKSLSLQKAQWRKLFTLSSRKFHCL